MSLFPAGSAVRFASHKARDHFLENLHEKAEALREKGESVLSYEDFLQQHPGKSQNQITKDAFKTCAIASGVGAAGGFVLDSCGPFPSPSTLIVDPILPSSMLPSVAPGGTLAGVTLGLGAGLVMSYVRQNDDLREPLDEYMVYLMNKDLDVRKRGGASAAAASSHDVTEAAPAVSQHLPIQASALSPSVA
jgi:hypothetical protein